MIGSSQKKKFVVVTILTLALLISSFLLVSAKSKTLKILGIAGWAPSESAKPVNREFSEYAKEKPGYEVNVEWTSVPWGNLYSKMSTTLASGSSDKPGQTPFFAR
jgi:ABC-type glycerol-3-phosphate transport system substrate-binding protein